MHSRRSLGVWLLLFVFAVGFLLSVPPAGAQNPEPYKATLAIRLDQPRWTINRNIYGHFAEHLGRLIYDGLWVGEDSSIKNTRGLRNDVVSALKELQVPVLRWQGCFADEYHWRDGIGPRDKRPRRPNASSVNALNTFERPNDVKPAVFSGYKLQGGAVVLNIPAKSVVMLELK